MPESSPAVSSTWSAEEREEYVDRLRSMLLIRKFEERIQALFLRGEVYGTTHLCNGQEAVPVGVAGTLIPGDRVAGSYRGHGQILALGIDPQALLNEMLGRATGINGGRAGSMNITAMQHGYMGSYGIIGGSIAAATGAGLALRGSGNVAVAFFGDGAANQAYFFECLNFASVFRLPVVYVCENNIYMEYTRTSDVTSGDVGTRSAALGVPAESVDGMEVWAVREAALRAVEQARCGNGPALVEAHTYRFVGHSRSDPAKYRPPGELDAWLERDPIVLCRARLEREGVEAAELDAVEAAVDAELEAMETVALEQPWPTPGSLPSEFASVAS